MTIETTVRDDVRVRVWADEDEDDCLSAAETAYIAAHPALDGWDLRPRWEDGERESIVLTVPAWAVAPDDERLD